MPLVEGEVARAAQRQAHDEHERGAAVERGGHEPRAHERGVPELVRRGEAEDPRGDVVHEDGHDESDHADGADRGVRHAAGLGAQVRPQVDYRQDEVGAEHQDVPHQGTGEVRVHEQLPQAGRAAEVDHDEADCRAGAAHARPDGDLGDAAEALHAEGVGHRRDDQAAGRQADEEHEVRDVEAPGVEVAHAGLHHAARKLHGPARDAGNGEHGRHDNGDVQALAAPGLTLLLGRSVFHGGCRFFIFSHERILP